MGGRTRTWTGKPDVCRRLNREVEYPCLSARSEMTVAGSCTGSPTRNTCRTMLLKFPQSVGREGAQAVALRRTLELGLHLFVKWESSRGP